MDVFNTSKGELTTQLGFTFQPGLNTLTREDYEKVSGDPGVERWTEAGFLVDPASVVVPGATALDDADRAELARLRALEQAGNLGAPPAGDDVTTKGVTATEAIAAINAATDLAALAAFESDTRKTVQEALAARKAALAQQ